MTKLARILRELRETGAREAFEKRYDYHFRRRFLRKVVYPRVAELHIRRLALQNRRRRSRLNAVRPARAGRVFVVICIDAEGPNQQGPNKDWAAVQRAVDEVMTAEVRQAYADSRGRPFAMSWFIVDWIGPSGGPRGLDVGFHKILDRYVPAVAAAKSAGWDDEIYWHYHHAKEGLIDKFNYDWRDAPVYEEIVSRRVVERGSYPVVFRAGNTWEDATCSDWLERWIPFDLSSRGPYRNVHYNWARAPQHWVLYHPAPGDVQRPGGQQRLMARSLDIEQDWLRPEEIEQAFLRAAAGEDSYVSFYMHDFRSMKDHIAKGVGRIREIAARYPSVEWLHANALTLFRELGNRQPTQPLSLTGERDGQSVVVRASATIYGEPWLAVNVDGAFKRIDMRAAGPRAWRADLPTGDVSAVAVAAADPAGQTAILRLDG